ncbi:MAG: redoxin domain-containing protein [Chloroflexi bacterium]|nr:redoxin domain-containing protein [Chloroflexota bacterium]
MNDLINRPAPDFALPIAGSGRVVLADLRGNVVVLHFWSAECPWSRRADIMIVYRQAAWERKGVRVVGVACSSNEPESEIRYEAGIRHIKYPIALDADQYVANLYKVQITPHFFVLDSRGVIRYTGGLDDVTDKQRMPRKLHLDRAVSALLGNRAPDPAFTPPFGTPIVRPASSTDLSTQPS